MRKSVPRRARRQLPIAGIGGQIVGRHAFPRDAFRARLRRGGAGRRRRPIGDERVEEPASQGILFFLLELPPDRAHLLAQFDAQPHRVVPQNLPRPPLHHLRADVERSENRVVRRRRGVQQKALVEAPMLDPPRLAADVAVLGVDLGGLREARQLLVRRLRRDDAGRVGAEILQPHREAAGEQGVEFHESRPGLVEQDVVAKRADLLKDHLGVVDRSVIGALLDDRDAERSFAPPRLLVRDERIVANLFADRRLVERLVIDRADQAVGVAVGLEEDRDGAAQKQRAVMGGLVVVAVEQDEIALRHQRRQHDLVGGRGSIEHEVGFLRAEDRRGLLLGLQRRTLVHQQVAQFDDRIVEIVAKDRLAEMLHEDAADRAAVVEYSAVMPRAGP